MAPDQSATTPDHEIAWICEACCEETDEPVTLIVGGYGVTYCPACAPDEEDHNAR